MNKIIEPNILSANTFHWRPNSSASGRRSCEIRNQEIVAEYFRAIGMEVEQNGDKVIGTREFNGKTVTAIFEYSESCKNVYKSLSVTNDGRTSNITLIRKIQAHEQAQAEASASN